MYDHISEEFGQSFAIQVKTTQITNTPTKNVF